PHFASPQDIKIGSDGTVFIAESGNDKPPDRAGILVMRPDGSLIERIGRYGNYDGQLQDLHWAAVGKHGQVYAADFTGRRVQKFVRGAGSNAGRELPNQEMQRTAARRVITFSRD